MTEYRGQDMTDFESRQRQSMADFNRSAWTDHPATVQVLSLYGNYVAPVHYEEISGGEVCYINHRDGKRKNILWLKQSEAMRQSCADMADLINFAKQSEFKEIE